MTHKSGADHLTKKVTALMGVITILTLLIQLVEPITAHDIWWHIVLGKQILESGSLIVDHSLLSWTPAAISDFVYNSWLSEIILYWIDLYLGTGGLIALRYFVFLGIVALAWHFSIKRGIAAHPLTWAIILLSLSFMWGAALIKPELFTLGFMPIVVWLYYYMRFKGDSGWYLPYLYPVVFLIWANMHGAFFVSSLFFISAVIGEFLNAKFSPDQAMPSKLRKHFLFALGLSVPVILINPYGYKLPIEIMLTVLFSDGVVAQNNIIGYQPTFLLNAPPLFLLDYLIASMLLFVFLVWQKLKARQTDWVAILAYIIYCILFVQMGRVTFYLGPVFLFTGLDLLAYKEKSWAWPSTKWSKYLLVLFSLALITLITGRAVYVQRCSLLRPVSLITSMFDPSSDTLSESANYVEKNLPGKKIGNEYDTGGYLMYRFWPEKKTMIDTRTFPFSAWIDDYFQFEAGNNVEEFMQTNKADFWIISYERPILLNWFATSKDWDLVFIGPNGSVFVPTTTAKSKPVISDKIDTLDNLPAITKVLSLTFLMNDPRLARRIYNAAVKTLCLNCGIAKDYVKELDNAVTGMELYATGNYRAAANKWKIPGNFIQSKGSVTKALMRLVEENWDAGDIVSARSTYLEILNLFPQSSMLDAYNFALLDWHYRHSDNQDLVELSDDLHWEVVINTILDNKTKLPQEQSFIINIAQEMKEGTYNGSAQLSPRY